METYLDALLGGICKISLCFLLGISLFLGAYVMIGIRYFFIGGFFYVQSQSTICPCRAA